MTKNVIAKAHPLFNQGGGVWGSFSVSGDQITTFAWDYAGDRTAPQILFNLYENDVLVASDIDALTYDYDATGNSGTYTYKIASVDKTTDLETVIATGIEVTY